MAGAIAFIVAVAAVVLLALIAPPLLRRRRRRLAQQRPLPPAMRAAVARNVSITNVLPAAEAQRLAGLVAAFLDEKRFIGCNGLEVTDEIRATIAAQACLLLLGRPGSLYDELQSILVYPDVFLVEDEVEHDDGLVTRRRRELSGEAWDAHRIILSWQDIADTAEKPADGYNVVLHEFAHHLEAEGRGLANGTRNVASWHDSLQQEYAALCAAVDRGEDTWLDPYGAEDATEFFAVVTEEFFECPAGLREAHPRLYELMMDFYGVDPAAWVNAAASAPDQSRQ